MIVAQNMASILNIREAPTCLVYNSNVNYLTRKLNVARCSRICFEVILANLNTLGSLVK